MCAIVNHKCYIHAICVVDISFIFTFRKQIEMINNNANDYTLFLYEIKFTIVSTFVLRLVRRHCVEASLDVSGHDQCVHFLHEASVYVLSSRS